MRAARWRITIVPPRLGARCPRSQLTDPTFSSFWSLFVGGVATLTAAVFTCADTALTSLSDTRLAASVIEATGRFQVALKRVEASRRDVQARYLAGRVLSVSAVVGSSVVLIEHLDAAPTTKMLLAGAGLFTLTAVLQTAAAAGRLLADAVVPRIALVLYPFEFALAPLALVTAAIARLLGPSPKRRPDPRITETEVEIMVDQGAASGVIDHGNAEMIRKVLDFPDLTARDAMIPRKQVVAIAIDTPLDEIADIVMQSGHSRYPVYRDDVDDVFGLLYAKDLFRVLRPPTSNSAPLSGALPTVRASRVRDIVREPVKIVPESRPLSELLRDMRQSRQHMAIVVDEFGGTSGVVTLEDVIEEIVGDIRDEHDAEQGGVVTLPEGRLLVDAAVLICDLTAPLGYDLDPDDEYDSLGGMITNKLGSVPSIGTTIRVHGFDLIVRDADEKHVTKVEICPCDATPAPRASKAGDSDAGVLEAG